MYGDCEICAESPRVDGKHFARCASGRNLLMIGGFAAQLCNGCSNEWHEYITEHPAMAAKGEVTKRRNDIDARMHIVSVPKSEMDAIYDDMSAAEDILYGVAKVWVADRKAARRSEKVVEEAEPAPK